MKTTLHARLSVELARVTYLQAALDGNLASPKIQNKLENNLQQSNYLLKVAYAAEKRGDMEVAQELISQIIKINQKVITKSQEQKQ